VALHGDSIKREDRLRNCFGDGPVGWINGGDAAEVAVAALLHPERFNGPVCYPTGSEWLNHHDIAEILTEELGRRVEFRPVSRSEWRQELIDLAEANPGGVVNTAMAGHISNVGEAVAARGAPPADSAALSALIGRAPVLLRDFIRDNRLIFESTQ